MRKAIAIAAATAVTTLAGVAAAQYPPQPQPYPQPYPQQPQPYPQQPYPQPGYQPYPQQPYGQPYGYPPPQPQVSNTRSGGEMAALYGTSVAYGIGTGIWIDALGKVDDPGLAFIAPLAFGAAMPIGVYLWDSNDTFRRGVPSSIATGLALGAVEGIAISGVQWQYTGNGGDSTWSFRTQTTVTFLTATGGGIGGYIFGEALRPDPRSLTFIASGAAWGAISGTLLGAGATPRRENTDSRADWKDSASVAGLIGYNVGIAATGALSLVYKPSFTTQKYMWLGFAGGTAVSSLVYLFYAFNSDAPIWHGMIANGVGGLAGIGVAAAITGNMQDDDSSVQRRSWLPEVHWAVMPSRGGASLSAFGTF